MSNFGGWVLKALGCKRVHDDRIAGVTFVGNTSCNALIVNEEYAWVGNPFSARRGLLRPLFLLAGERILKQNRLFVSIVRPLPVFRRQSCKAS